MDPTALLPGAVGIAASPLTVASIVFLLGHRTGIGSAVACAIGWITTITVFLVLAVFVGEQLPNPSAGGPPVPAIVALCASGLLAALAAWQWVRRRTPDGSPRSARWGDAMSSVGPARAFGLGALLFLSPKLFVLVLAAGLTFGDADPGALRTIVAAGAFVLVSGSTALVPIGLAVALGPRADRPLGAVRRWIARRGSVSLVAVLGLLALVQLVVGLVGLAAHGGPTEPV